MSYVDRSLPGNRDEEIASGVESAAYRDPEFGPTLHARRLGSLLRVQCRGTDSSQAPFVVKQAKEMEMDWNRVEGNWKQMKGKIKEKWGNLTDDDLTAINGKRDQLEGKIQERYGMAKDQVRKDVDDWYDAQTW